MDDFDGGFEDNLDNDDNDGTYEETFSESEMDNPETNEEDVPLEADDSCGGIQWQDWMLLGPISEELAREKAEQERLIRENGMDEDF